MERGTPHENCGEVETSQWEDLFRTPMWFGAVRFSDIDAAGNVNYAIFLQYVDDALVAWWSGLNLPFKPMPTALGLVTAGACAAWLEPLTERGEIEGQIGVASIGNTSFEIYAAIRRKQDVIPCFVARLAQVYWRDEKPTMIPNNLREELCAKVWSNPIAEWIEAALTRGGRSNHANNSSDCTR